MENPKIRFKGYTKDWEQRKLGELGTVQTCKRIFKDQTSEKGDIPFFKNGTIGLEPDSYISREMYEEFRRLYPYPEVGDTLISVVGSIGRTAEYTGKDEYFQDSNVVWLKTDGSINKKFLKISYQVIKWLIEGSTVKHLYNDNILRSEIIMPVSQIEQAKIAEFFEELDHLITLHQRKCEQTKKLKKYMLQKMFPQNGAKVPEIRFDGFTYDWEQRKLGDMGSTFTGLSGKTKEDFGHGDAQFITYMNVFSNPVANLEMTEAVEIDAKQNRVKKGDVFFTTSSETPEEVGMSCVMPENKDNIYLNSFCFGYRPTEKFDLDYLAYVLRADSFRKEMKFLAQGISRYNISKNKVMEVSIPIPNLEEQTMVGRYFSNLDHLITLHQRKYNKLLNVKKSMLEKMFPKNESNIPEIRFKGFADPWEQRKLGDILISLQNNTLSRADLSNEAGVAKNVHYGDVLIKFGEVLDVSKEKLPMISDESVLSKYKSSFLQNGDVIVADTAEDSTVGKCSEIAGLNDEVVLSGLHTIPYRPIEKFASGYLGYYLNSSAYHNHLIPLMQGIKVTSISKSAMQDTDIVYPKSVEEQGKIGDYFQSLDHLITLHQRLYFWCKLRLIIRFL